MDTQLIPLIILIIIAGWGIWRGVTGVKCPNCQARLDLEKTNDPFGINITKTISISFRKYTNVDRYFICPKCSNKYFLKYNSNKIIEIKDSCK